MDTPAAAGDSMPLDAPAVPSDETAANAPPAVDEGAATESAKTPADEGAPASPKPDADTPAADVSATPRRGGQAHKASDSRSPRRKQGSGKGRRKRR